MASFTAGTQYGDWEGTAAADGAHSTSFAKYLRDHTLMTEEEVVLAISLYVLEGHTYVSAYLFNGGPSSESVQAAFPPSPDPIPVREVKIELTSEEFIRLFKRFNVVLTSSNMNLEGREYVVEGE